MKRRLKKFKDHKATGWEYWKPYYKKWWRWKEKKSELWFSFEYELNEIWSNWVEDIRRWDKEVKHIIVDDVFDVFFLSDGRIVTL